jgi:hypothetical protein
MIRAAIVAPVRTTVGRFGGTLVSIVGGEQGVGAVAMTEPAGNAAGEWDALVIGAGAGGLFTAARLAAGGDETSAPHSGRPAAGQTGTAPPQGEAA